MLLNLRSERPLAALRFGPVLRLGSVLVLALGVAACGGTPSSEPLVASVASGPAKTTAPAADRAALAQQYIACMRAHKIPMLDQLTAEGIPQVDKERVSIDQVGPATKACGAFMPAAQDAQSVLTPADLKARQAYSACIRAHGVPEYPDPDSQSGDVELSDAAAQQLKQNDKLPGAMEACRNVMPKGSDSGTVGG